MIAVTSGATGGGWGAAPFGAAAAEAMDPQQEAAAYQHHQSQLDGGLDSATVTALDEHAAASEDADTNLIVNYIPNSVTDDQLAQVFSKFGTVESARIIKEKGTRKSLGYGFVRFRTAGEAVQAIHGLNGTKIENKVLKVAIARPQGAEKNTNIYVASLDPSVSSQGLHVLFGSFGRIVDAKVLLDRVTNQSRCVGFIRFDTSEEAEAAVAAMNGFTVPGTGKPLTVRLAQKREKRPPVPMAAGPSRFGGSIAGVGGVGGVGQPYVMSGESAYAGYGYSQIPAMEANGWGYGPAAGGMPGQAPGMAMPAYGGGMASYQPAYNAGNVGLYNQQMAMQMYQGMQMAQSQLGGRPPQAPAANACLFVYNLPAETDENYLYHLFSPYGSVANVKVMRDPATNLCKGFGFVNMSKLEEAQAGIAALNGAFLGHKMLQVSFKQARISNGGGGGGGGGGSGIHGSGGQPPLDPAAGFA